ncbi:MAG: RNA polymerase sigma factor [Lentisphaeraceae bacterium]|nr:RNA polymerase sigma factor [Lentisphaeraceae bacterium]
MQTSHTLLERVRNRSDENSWSEFDDIYRPYILNVVKRMNFTHEEAEDLCQNIILILWEKIPEFKHNFRTGAFRSWLCTIVRNRAINIINKNQRISEKLTTKNEEALSPYIKTSQNDLEQIAKEEWIAHITDLAWKKIEDEFEENIRRAFTMSLKNIPGEEIAEELGIKLNSVYVYKNRIKKRLEEIIRILKVQYV